MLLDLMKGDHQVIISDLSDRFGIDQMLTDNSKDLAFMASFLYYFGVLTIEEETEAGELILRVPNLVTRGIYVERIQKMLLPEPSDRDDGVLAGKQLYTKGNISTRAIVFRYKLKQSYWL